ncbi:MAG: SDR family oxidoreductase, partial [Alphaproteobacteria bacterium]|nr:SDR family oxidoreductase [Alphaproteobacteria bacterium]
YWGGYAITKAALETMALTWAMESQTTALKVNVLNPGPLRTRMRAQAMPGEDPLQLAEPEAVAPLIVKLLSPQHSANGEVFMFCEDANRI